MSLDLLPAFVFALYYFIEAALVVLWEVLENDDGRAFVVGAMDFPEVARCLVGLHLFPLLLDLTSDFEETIAFKGTLDHFIRAVLSNVFINLSSLNLASALVSAFNNVLGALCSDVLFHFAERKSKAALKQTFYDSVRAFLGLVLLHVLSENEAAVVAIWACKILIRTDLEVLVHLTFPDNFVTVLVGASYREF